MSYIEINEVSKSYKDHQGDMVPVLDGFDLNINKGGFISVFGPNGCGKSTLFNIIAGLIPYDSGSILIDDKKSEKSKIGFVFQNYSESLFPWLTNIDNIAFSLDSETISRKQKKLLFLILLKKSACLDCRWINIHTNAVPGNNNSLHCFGNLSISLTFY